MADTERRVFRQDTVWEIVSIAIKRANPSTSLILSNEVYKFPFVDVCLDTGFGCSSDDASACTNTTLAFGSFAEYDGETSKGAIDQDYPKCLGFDLTIFDVGDGEMTSTITANIEIIWVVNEGMDASQSSYTESVDLHMGCIKSGGVSIAAPYNSISFDEGGAVEFQLTAMTIGKTVRKFLSQDSISIFPVLSLSTTQRVVPDTTHYSYYSAYDDDDDYEYYADTDTGTTGSELVYGFLSLDITLGSYSLTTVKDANPLDIGTFFGNIGGFWELMTVVWALCFVAHRREEVVILTARNFAEVFQRGKEKITGRNDRSATSPSDPRPMEEGEVWGNSYRESGGNESSTSTRLQNVSAPRRSSVGARFRRPVVFDNRRCSDEFPRSTSGSSSLPIDATTARRADPPSYDEVEPA